MDDVERKVIKDKIWLAIFCCIILVSSFFVGWTIKDCILCTKDRGLDYYGNLGDYLSGSLGAVIALVNVIFLWRTLTSQIETSLKQQENNNHNTDIYINQQFSAVFTSFIDLYHTTLDLFCDNTCKGKEYLKIKVENIRTSTKGSLVSFNEFYTDHREVAAAYFRLVYRIYKYIYDSELSPKKKQEYAHIVRSQFSEDEIVLLRYNALTINGVSMQYYINEYNILEHLPLSKLNVFSKWFSVFNQDKILVSDVDNFLLNIRYSLITMLSDKHYIPFHDYGFNKVKITGNNKLNVIHIVFQVGSNHPNFRTPLCKIYQLYNDDEKYKRFMTAVLIEFFERSSFSEFSKTYQKLYYQVDIIDNDIKSCKLTIRNRKLSPIVLTREQMSYNIKQMNNL